LFSLRYSIFVLSFRQILMDVLGLEPYYGGSHRAFLDGWSGASRHSWTVLSLPPRKWKWRMRHASITFAEQGVVGFHPPNRFCHCRLRKVCYPAARRWGKPWAGLPGGYGSPFRVAVLFGKEGMMIQEQFEPMTVGQILDRAFRLYRRNFIRFIAIVAVIQVPMFLLSLVVGRMGLTQAQEMATTSEGPATGVSLMLVLAGSLLTMFSTSLCNGALLKSISGTYLGQDVTVGGAYRFVLPKLLALVGASIVVTLVVGVGFILLIVPGVIFALMYILTSQVIVLEGRGVFKGMTRSKQLGSGNKGKIFLLWLLVTIVAVIVQGLFEAAAGLFTGRLEPGSAMMVKQLFNLTGQTLVMPIYAGAFILLYYDLRIRKEGFDLEMLARSLGAAQTAETVSDAGEPPAE